MILLCTSEAGDNVLPTQQTRILTEVNTLGSINHSVETYKLHLYTSIFCRNCILLRVSSIFREQVYLQESLKCAHSGAGLEQIERTEMQTNETINKPNSPRTQWCADQHLSCSFSLLELGSNNNNNKK